MIRWPRELLTDWLDICEEKATRKQIVVRMLSYLFVCSDK